jgi:hypothetical protein
MTLPVQNLGIMERTEAEKGLVSRMDEIFGKHLTTFLRGCGNSDGPARCLSFAAILDGGEGERRLKVVSEESAGLPKWEQSLVLLALIELMLCGKAENDSKLLYTHEDVTRLLGWDNTEQTQAEIAQSVAKYFDLSYDQVATSDARGMGPNSTFLSRKRLMVGYEFAEDFPEDGRRAVSLGHEVTFNSCFIEELKNKSLFGITWNRVLFLRLLKEEN